MGANAQTSVPTFTAGEVLTAANMNISARTGVPVFADSTARDAGFGGTGEKTLAEGQLCYLESTNVVQYYDGAVWATVGPTTVTTALTRIGGGTLSGSSTTFSNVFSATYTHYLVTVSNSLNATTAGRVNIRFGAATTGYYSTSAATRVSDSAYNADLYANTGQHVVNSNGTSTPVSYMFWCIAPFLTENSRVWGSAYPNTSDVATTVAGFLNNTTSYTDLVFLPAAGTFSSGTVNIYGLALS